MGLEAVGRYGVVHSSVQKASQQHLHHAPALSLTLTEYRAVGASYQGICGDDGRIGSGVLKGLVGFDPHLQQLGLSLNRN